MFQTGYNLGIHNETKVKTGGETLHVRTHSGIYIFMEIGSHQIMPDTPDNWLKLYLPMYINCTNNYFPSYNNAVPLRSHYPYG